mmetsp:Transcript_22299/g.48718  ORF Transcript_22299/g.48718 Transcript_22299/m.48718 type:complete len:225 (-) Transcript_22299:736-1410(-)
MVVGEGDEGGGARLGQAVALHHGGAHDDLEELFNMKGQGRTPRHDDAHLAPQPLLHLVEHQAVRDDGGLVMLPARPHVPELAVVGPVEYEAVQCSCMLHLVLDAGIDALKHSRHPGKDCGLERLNVVCQLLDVPLEVADRGAHMQHRLLHHPVKDVRQWQVREEGVMLVQHLVKVGEEVQDAGNAGQHGAVCDGDALGVTCCATGVHDGAQVIRQGHGTRYRLA